MQFTIEKKLNKSLARAGVITTPHGDIQTPAYIAPATKATVKAIPPEAVKALGGEAVLANTYHLYLQPGSELVKEAGGINKFMNWSGPTFTDSGGFQVFSLAGGGSKFEEKENTRGENLVKISEDGVEFRSHIDGSKHFFTPEKSMQIQHDLGADIILAFDECTSPTAPYEYQVEALERTHRWAERSLAEHKKLGGEQALFGIVQGGRHKDLRELSAKTISAMNFDGYAIGGSFDKEDMGTAVRWVNEILPEDKPRHLLGIGAVEDLFLGIENGVDTFDCVSPTREARNGALYTKHGRINITNTKYKKDFSPIDIDCACDTCNSYTRAYIAHLFKANELLAFTLASVHNLHFFVQLVKNIRQSILDDTFSEYKEEFLGQYISK